MSCTPDPVIKSCNTTDQRIPYFDSCQLTIAWMSKGLCDISHLTTRTGGHINPSFFHNQISRMPRQPNFHGAPLESFAMTVIASVILIT